MHFMRKINTKTRFIKADIFHFEKNANVSTKYVSTKPNELGLKIFYVYFCILN